VSAGVLRSKAFCVADEQWHIGNVLLVAYKANAPVCRTFLAEFACDTASV